MESFSLVPRFETVLSNKHCDLTTLQPCNHSEADTRIFLHLAHAAKQGHTKAYVRTVDSDVVVLAVGFFETLGLTELLVGFGTGRKYRDIPVHTIYSDLGPSKSLALPLFHSLTGCDTTPQLLGCGKKTAWSAWTSLPDLTDTLMALTREPDIFLLESMHMQRIERFVVLMYSKGCVWCNQCQCSQTSSLHHWKQIAGKYPTYSSRAIPACKASTITGEFLLESVHHDPAGNS